MRIYHITAGPAGMYCGSCIRPQRPQGAEQETTRGFGVVAEP